MRITTRIMVLAAPSLLGMIYLSSVILGDQLEKASKLDQVAQLSTLSSHVGALIHELQKERGVNSVYLASHGAQFQKELGAQRPSTNEKLAVASRRNAVETSAQRETAAQIDFLQSELKDLPAIRAKVDTLELTPQENYDYFSARVAGLMDFLVRESALAEDPSSARSFLALFDLMQAKERAGQERSTGGQGFAAKHFTLAIFDRFKRLRLEQESLFQHFAAFASPVQQASLDAALADPANAEIVRLRKVVDEGGLVWALRGIDGAIWFKAATVRLNLLRDAEVRIAGALEASANAKATDARRWFKIVLTGIVAATVALACCAAAVGQSLSAPLLRMTRAMTALAAGDHAVAVPASGRGDEIGKMAAAFEVFRVNAIMRLDSDARIAHMARHDALTDLPNRVTFLERVDQAVALTGRGGIAAVFCIDLDDFKAVNDRLGHYAGDRLLCTVADRLRACARETDTVARFGGDEFAVVQVGLTRPEDARMLAARMLQIVGEPIVIEGHRFKPGLSIGIALAPLDGTDVDRLMKNADVALHRVKAEGGNDYRFFEPEMEAKLQVRRQLEADLSVAVENEQFHLVYQPLVDARTSAINGFEALVRWDHPTRGTIPPIDFISVAEETGLIVALGDWILRRACLDATSWPGDVPVAVNLSPVQFKDGRLVDKVLAALEHSGLSATRLELEITESVLLRDEIQTTEMLHRIRAMGVRIAMDDFGTGYSSLSYLRSFPFDKIKIDRSFIQGLGKSEDADAIVRAITMLGASLGMSITAEGVETRAQLEKLKGCAQLQGYFFSPPRPATDISAIITASHVTTLGERTNDLLLSA